MLVSKVGLKNLNLIHRVLGSHEDARAREGQVREKFRM